jgi:hypothetical protein
MEIEPDHLGDEVLGDDVDRRVESNRDPIPHARINHDGLDQRSGVGDDVSDDRWSFGHEHPTVHLVGAPEPGFVETTETIEPRVVRVEAHNSMSATDRITWFGRYGE